MGQPIKQAVRNLLREQGISTTREHVVLLDGKIVDPNDAVLLRWPCRVILKQYGAQAQHFQDDAELVLSAAGNLYVLTERVCPNGVALEEFECAAPYQEQVRELFGWWHSITHCAPTTVRVKR